MKNQNFKKIE